MRAFSNPIKHAQQGVTAVEFALVAAILLVLLFGIIEFGRLFFTLNSVQEITRRAAREQVVRSPTIWPDVQRLAVLNSPGNTPAQVNFPGSPDITNLDVQIRFYNSYEAARDLNNAGLPATAGNVNYQKCLQNANDCIRYVRATLIRNGQKVRFNEIALFVPMGFVIAPWKNELLLPYSTVIMPAEALGLL